MKQASTLILTILTFFSLLLPLTAYSFVSGYQRGHVYPPLACNPQDPYERFNRATFGFNDTIDTVVLSPIARLYNKIIPKPLNAGIHNFYMNLGELPVIANDALQFHFYQLLNDAWRLGVNTTVGIGGFFDVASRINLPYYSNDFGLTLSRYGWKNSKFVVWPLLGPFTIRDTLGVPVDYYEFAIYPYIRSWGTRTLVYGGSILDKRAQLLKFQGIMDEAAIDKYAFIRSAYMQRRTYQVAENEKLGFITPSRN